MSDSDREKRPQQPLLGERERRRQTDRKRQRLT